MHRNMFIDSVFKSAASDWCYNKHAILVMFVFTLCAWINLSVLLCTGVHSQMYMYIASLHHLDQLYLLQKNEEVVEAYKYDSVPSIFSFCYRHTYKPTPTALSHPYCPTPLPRPHPHFWLVDWCLYERESQYVHVCVCLSFTETTSHCR